MDQDKKKLSHSGSVQSQWVKGKLDPEEVRSILNGSPSHGVRGSHSRLSTYKSAFPTRAVHPALQKAGDSHTALHPS